jgi:hypothetical protein
VSDPLQWYLPVIANSTAKQGIKIRNIQDSCKSGGGAITSLGLSFKA